MNSGGNEAMTIFTNLTSPSFVEIKNRLLQGFNSIKQLKHVHALLLRLGLDQDNYLLNMVLRSSFNLGDTIYTSLIFTQTKQPNMFLWNTMIRGFVSNDCFQRAIGFYHFMRIDGFLPNNFTFPFVLKACTRQLDFQLGVRLHTIIVKAGFDSDVFVKTSLLCLYAKCGFLDDALKVFDDIPEKNVVSWTAIITGYINEGKFREAVDTFRKLLEMGVRPDSFSLVRVLSACAQLGDLSSGEWIEGYVREVGMERNVFVTTALVDLYVKCGNMERARCVFDGMPEKDIVTWGTMIQGYASYGFPKEALDVFFRMQRENLEPDGYSMVGVLSACASLGALELGVWASNLMDRNEFLSNPVMETASQVVDNTKHQRQNPTPPRKIEDWSNTRKTTGKSKKMESSCSGTDKSSNYSGSSNENPRVPLSDVVAECVKRWFKDTLKEAKSGDINMQVLVAQMYYSGYGVARDTQKGRLWMTRASRTRSSVWKVSDKRPGYNASDSDSDELKGES
ncbi:hypothetical protein QYF36_018715 [Acer negundo]|nr:hypothetical protein QYF36_018715 [Acer negundo]